MATATEVPDNWDRFGVRHERRNGLILRMAKENRPTPGNVIDDVLAKAGVDLVSDKDAIKELRKMGRTDLIKRWFKEATA